MKLPSLQAGRAFGAVRAGVNDLSVDAGNGLRGLEILFVGQTNDVGELHPVFLALIYVSDVERGDADFDVTKLTGLLLNDFSNVFAIGFSRWLQLSGQAGCHNQVAVQLVVFLADLTHFGVLVAQGVRPVPGSALSDVHRLNRILARVPVNFALIHRDTWSRLQLLWYRDSDRCFAQILTRAPYLMTDLKHILLLMVGLRRYAEFVVKIPIPHIIVNTHPTK